MEYEDKINEILELCSKPVEPGTKEHKELDDLILKKISEIGGFSVLIREIEKREQENKKNQ